MATGMPDYKGVGRAEMETCVAEFLKELEETISEGWKMSVEKKNLVVARKRTPNTDVYRLRMVGQLPFSLEIVDTVLNNTPVRLKWDKGVTAIDTLEQLESGLEILYFSTNAPPGISNRDFVHVRIQTHNADTGTKIILDKSVTHPAKSKIKGYIRANTIFSGLVLTRKQVQEGGRIIEVTQYAAISQVDVAGDIPKLIINAVTAKATADWFENLEKACIAYTSGKLGTK